MLILSKIFIHNSVQTNVFGSFAKQLPVIDKYCFFCHDAQSFYSDLVCFWFGFRIANFSRGDHRIKVIR